jgi:thioesterase domain-containing protein
MEHQEMPFDAIAALPGASQVSLARAVFSMQGDAGWTLALDRLAVKRIPLNNALAVFDLFMTLDATQKETTALLEYRADALDATEAQALLRAYEDALRALVAQPDGAISDWVKQAGATHAAPQTSRPAYAPPKTPVQKQLVALWEAHFNRAPIGIHDDFFALGGNSLLAYRLFGQIARDMNANLPLATLYQHTTIERLAAVIEQQPAHRAWSSLVAIQPRGERLPFFGIHGQDGNVLFWRHLVKYLHPDQPFYGIQARGVDGYSKPLSRIEEMAALYLSEVQQVQPAGPYYMGGFSMGGEIAFEMAQRIVAQGGRVDLLVLFDTGNPDRPIRKPATASPDDAESHVSIANATPVNRFDILRRKLMNHMRRLSGMTPREQARYLFNDLQYRTHRARLRSATELYRRLGRRLPPSILQPYLSSIHMEAVLNYLPQPYAGRVTLFRAKQTLVYSPLNSPMGWEPLALGGLELHLFDATHRIVDEEFAEAVGKCLQSCLDKAQMAEI